jgi:integrase
MILVHTSERSWTKKGYMRISATGKQPDEDPHDAGGLQWAVKANSSLARIPKPVNPQTFRHCFATLLLSTGFDIRTVQELLGQKDVKTTMIYTHVLDRGPEAVRSLLD